MVARGFLRTEIEVQKTQDSLFRISLQRGIEEPEDQWTTSQLTVEAKACTSMFQS